MARAQPIHRTIPSLFSLILSSVAFCPLRSRSPGDWISLSAPRERLPTLSQSTVARMIRSVAPRVVSRPLSNTSIHSQCQSTSLARFARHQDNLLTRQVKPLALSVYRRNLSLTHRHASAVAAAPGTTRDTELEARLQKQLINATPELVSTSSSVHPVLEEVGTEQKEDDTDMMAGLRHDVVRPDICASRRQPDNTDHHHRK